jgi:CheY-like chemotaxis protein
MIFKVSARIGIPTARSIFAKPVITIGNRVMKYSFSVTKSLIECLEDSKAVSAAKPPNAVHQKAAAQYASPQEPEKAGSEKAIADVLLADDDAGVRDFLATLLRRANYSVTCAGDGEEAWVALCAAKYDVLITDHSMPKLTGLALIRRLRVGPLNMLPCILISGQLPWEEKDLLDLVRPGMAMAKPFSFLQLLTCVRSFLPVTEPEKRDAAPCLPPERKPNHTLWPGSAWQDEARRRQPCRRLARAS